MICPFRPSLHQSFDPETEMHEQKLFEEAEENGKTGADCDLLYGDNCRNSPLETISKFMHVNDL